MPVNKIYILLVLFLFFREEESFAQDNSFNRRIILIGDAGEQKNNVHPALEFLKKNFTLDKRSTVIFLGDNIYPKGLPPESAANYGAKKQILDSQINVVAGTGASAYFVAGNHDWMQGRRNGYRQLVNQYRYIQSRNLPNVNFVPDSACPGPQEIMLSENITLVVLDSQWWLHRYDKPSAGSGCSCTTESEILTRLQEIVDRNKNKMMIFAAHHPFITFGKHGGYFKLKQHIFPLTDLNPILYIPLPVAGSLYPLIRSLFRNVQDTKHPVYKSFSGRVDSILNRHPYCIRASGHEHNLQFISQNNHNYIVSGSGAKKTDVKKDDRLIFSSSKNGFVIIEVMDNGNVRVKYIIPQDGPEPQFARDLKPIGTNNIHER